MRKKHEIDNFNNSNNSSKELMKFFRKECRKKTKKLQLYQIYSKQLVFYGTTSTSVNLSVKGSGLTVRPISIEIARGTLFGNQKIYELLMQKFKNENKLQPEKAQRTIDKLA